MVRSTPQTLPPSSTKPSAAATPTRSNPMPSEMDRTEYAATYGPTTGDRIRLGDTS
ncbi:MAG: hypothetical protein GY722_28190, partial [bacterium]|nr:hypothetical protein [bacterium]